jgi:uncharacterized protein YjiS (DUF1127 family)
MLSPSKSVRTTVKRQSVRGCELSDESRNRRDPTQTLARSGADANSVPETVAAMTLAGATWPSVLWLFLEGFALYGASLYGITTAPVSATASEGVPQPRELSWRERRRSISLVSSSANAEMIARERERRVDQIGLLSGTRSATDGYETRAVNQSSRRGWRIRTWRAIAGRWAKWRREQEIKGAVAALEEFDDRTLRDMGMRSRAEIEQAVRYGRYWLG